MVQQFDLIARIVILACMIAVDNANLSKVIKIRAGGKNPFYSTLGNEPMTDNVTINRLPLLLLYLTHLL